MFEQTSRFVALLALTTIACATDGNDERDRIDSDHEAKTGTSADRASKADDPRAGPSNDSERLYPAEPRGPCDDPGAYACYQDHVLFCRAGYGASKWIDRGPCTNNEYCANAWGCAPLPLCDDSELLACVDKEVFACQAGQWSWQETCPGGVPCIHGRGCPNELGISTTCGPGERPRCHDNQIMRCQRAGLDFDWSAPVPCPQGSECLDGEGCVRPGNCSRRGQAVCVDNQTAKYCVEQEDGALGWSSEIDCGNQCTPGTGCHRPCRRVSWTGVCLDD